MEPREAPPPMCATPSTSWASGHDVLELHRGGVGGLGQHKGALVPLGAVLEEGLDGVRPHVDGETLEAAAQAVLEFDKGLIDALADVVPAVKRRRERRTSAPKPDSGAAALCGTAR